MRMTPAKIDMREPSPVARLFQQIADSSHTTKPALCGPRVQGLKPTTFVGLIAELKRRSSAVRVAGGTIQSRSSRLHAC